MNFLRRIALLFTAVLMISAAMADGKGATRTIVPIDLSFANPCTGELMQTFGSILILSREEIDKNGTVHLVFKELLHDLSAVGLDTGQRYKAVGTTRSQLLVQTTDGTGTFMFVSRFGYVSQGSDPNWFQTQVFKITINANGEVAVVRDIPATFECR